MENIGIDDWRILSDGNRELTILPRSQKVYKLERKFLYTKTLLKKMKRIRHLQHLPLWVRLDLISDCSDNTVSQSSFGKTPN